MKYYIDGKIGSEFGNHLIYILDLLSTNHDLYAIDTLWLTENTKHLYPQYLGFYNDMFKISFKYLKEDNVQDSIKINDDWDTHKFTIHEDTLKYVQDNLIDYEKLKSIYTGNITLSVIENSVVMNVRYKNYLTRYMKDYGYRHYTKQTIIETINLYAKDKDIVFVSDDMGIVRNMHLENRLDNTLYYLDHKFENDFIAMLFAKTNIDSASTFSIMASLLNRYNDNVYIPYPYISYKTSKNHASYEDYEKFNGKHDFLYDLKKVHKVYS